MSHKLEESYKDFELLSLEWDKIDKSLLESKKVYIYYYYYYYYYYCYCCYLNYKIFFRIEYLRRRLSHF